MRTFGYGLGLALVLAGAAVGVAELFTIVQGAPSTLSLGAMWYRLHANSLVGFQALIENGLSPALWPPVQVLLTVPAWLLLVPLGLLLLVLCRPRGAGR
jgi:hypothetical protein